MFVVQAVRYYLATDMYRKIIPQGIVADARAEARAGRGVARGRGGRGRGGGKCMKSALKAPPPGPRTATHPKLGSLYVVYATKQSYILFKNKTTKKQTLLLAVTESMTKDHGPMIVKLLKAVVSKSMSKEQAVALRRKLLGK